MVDATDDAGIGVDLAEVTGWGHANGGRTGGIGLDADDG